MRIALVELPAIKLCDESGRNWTACRQHEPLVSKQILLAQLRSYGHDVSLVNLKRGNSEYAFGEVSWRGLKLTKFLVGTSIEDYPVEAFDLWGFTVNYMQEREIGCRFIRHVTSQGGVVIVGGSDALAVPARYAEAGAAAVIADKSGAINRAAIDYVMNGRRNGNQPQLTVEGQGRLLGRRGSALSPEDWALPDIEVAANCLGTQYWEGDVPDSLLPIGSIVPDSGCDRKCNFCQTPNYRIGYKGMSPRTAIRWLARQKDAGARSVIFSSDQFLGRMLWDWGRQDITEIVNGARNLGLAILWGNGLELKKATRGRGLPGGDPTPDEELCSALWGWDGNSGCYNAYLPGERPIEGDKAYKKLLPWREHITLMRAIAQTGIPDISYGVIVGMADDSDDTLAQLEDALHALWMILKRENPELKFRVTPLAVRPLPGTPQTQLLDQEGLLPFSDPAICGGFWTSCANTRYLTYEEVSDWQMRLARVGDVEYMRCQGVSGLVAV